MLTPQEVSERAFPKASFGGYNMSQVDEFLDVLTADYTALYNENAVLKSKMKVLVEKVEEYRTTEDAMRKALMTAQRIADDMVQEAEQKKADIINQAEAEAMERVQALRREYEYEQARLSSARQATTAYVEKIRGLHRQQLSYLDSLDEFTPAPAATPVEDAASEIDGNVQRLLAQAMADAAAENQKLRQGEQTVETAPEPGDTAEYPIVQSEEAAAQKSPQPAIGQEEAMVGSQRIDFDNLQFGRDYEIK